MTMPSAAQLVSDARRGTEFPFNHHRYPFTYAADFLRDNPQHIPADVWDRMGVGITDSNEPLSRSQSSQIRQSWAQRIGVEDRELAERLADAYLAAHGASQP